MIRRPSRFAAGRAHACSEGAGNRDGADREIHHWIQHREGDGPEPGTSERRLAPVPVPSMPPVQRLTRSKGPVPLSRPSAGVRSTESSASVSRATAISMQTN